MPHASRPPVRLYCFPHAGSSSMVYRNWTAPEGAPLQVVGVDQPGRGPRAREPRIADFPALVRSLAEEVIADVTKARQERGDLAYATFGHSFGATLSLVVGAAVARTLGEPPAAAVLSAAVPPRLRPDDDTIGLSDEELLAKIIADGGTPPGLLANATMAQMVVRMMREDYVIRGQFPRDDAPWVDYPLTLVAAREDVHARPEEVWRWSEHTTADCRRVEIDGGHFAAMRDPRKTLGIVADAVWPGRD
ncbi:alpha/beta fold hydrolase [Streptomyces sp. TRM70308]|uniref:thioesterase II family protein n=1 Tax=Streptomyces sp. TRM70308 TaxID=3131932 RepID=UPI003D025FFF